MTNYDKVKEFHKKYELPAGGIPIYLHSAEIVLRMRLMMEELTEVIEALQMGTKEEIAKELADLLYVVYGTAVSSGIKIDAVFAKVHDSNMTKSLEIDEGGKITKGPDYVPVEMETLLDDQLTD